MTILFLLLAVLPVTCTDSLSEMRERGAQLEAAHQWEDASKLYKLILKQGRVSDSANRFWLLTSLAEVEFERQEYTQSERWLLQAERMIDGLAVNAPERIQLLNAWGTLHLVQGKLTAAERELSRSVQLGESVASPEDHAAALHNLAAVEMHFKRIKTAVAHEKRALEIWRPRLGEGHYYVMKAWISLSSAQGLSGDWPAAEQSLRHALAITHSEEALANYAVVLDKLKRGKEAKAIRSRLQVAASPAPALIDVRALTQHDGLGVRSR